MNIQAEGRLRVSVLGPVRAWLDHQELNLGSAHQRTAFAVLAANPNRVVTVEELVRAIWGEAPPPTATGSVYTYVSGLRKVLQPFGQQLLASLPSGYTLWVDELDATRFRNLTAASTELRDSGDPHGAAERLDAALALWHGEPYAGLSVQQIEVERAHLAEQRMAAVEKRARIRMDLGDDGVVAELAVLIHDHPLHEPLHELLMLALHRAGRHAEALSAFHAARRTLAEELGVEPGPALLELHRRVRRAAADSGSTFGGLTEVPAARGTPGLLGRDTEIAMLQALLARAVDGRGAAAWIEGEPGIGKTALLNAALGGAAAVGFRTYWVRTDFRDRQPLAAAARAFGMDPAEVRDERLCASVRRACEVSPVVVVADDIQWSDDDSMLLWDRLATATLRLPLLLVVATRPGPPDGPPTWLKRGWRARQGHVLNLPRLSDEEICEIMSGMVGAPLGTRLLEIVPLCAGNPLIARDLAEELLRQGVVSTTAGVADIDSTAPLDVPSSLLSMIYSTLDSLTSETKDALRTTALLDSRFTVDDLAAVTGRPPDDLLTDLEEALHSGVLEDTGTQLTFRSPLLRQALYMDAVPRLRGVKLTD